jgi:outer membrane protein assembly factor BamB
VGTRDFSTLSLRLDEARGDRTETHVAWKVKSGGARIPSPLVLDGLYYFVEDNGVANCLKADGGERVWRERLGGNKYSASPVAGDGKLYFTGEDGSVTVVQAGPTFKVLGRNDVGELVVASPALSQGCVFLRGDKHLYCISAR